uniref:Bilin biosynthesis protein n=1 Tax=Prochlorococcus marinus TaxID=1219 RepID=Q9S334_PROMR|nr:bilin biosynthesis protein [Prochlorococcus marinus]
MSFGAFDTLPKLSQKDALHILKTPIDELKLSSDYYKAVFHLAKYPSRETEEALMDLLISESMDNSILIAKRKAIEVLGRLGCKKAITIIGNNLKSKDPYLVENAAWALQELSCADAELHNLIGCLLEQSHQNQRVLIQSLAKMGAISELPKIKQLLVKDEISSGVKGAAIAAISRLTGESNNLDILRSNLDLDNQNDRQSAVQDIIDAKEYSLLELVLQTPVSPYFRIRSIELLWDKTVDHLFEFNLTKSLDLLLLDDPKNIRILNHYQSKTNSNFLVKELFSTDFRKCYLALSSLLKIPKEEIWTTIKDYLQEFKKDYGALYFLMIILRKINDSGDKNNKISIELLNHCLDDSWPKFMKFKAQAILASVDIDKNIFYDNYENWLNEEKTPYWVCRYATLMCIQRLIDKENQIKFKDALLRIKVDSNKFVRLKVNDLLI